MMEAKQCRECRWAVEAYDTYWRRAIRCTALKAGKRPFWYDEAMHAPEQTHLLPWLAMPTCGAWEQAERQRWSA